MAFHVRPDRTRRLLQEVQELRQRATQLWGESAELRTRVAATQSAAVETLIEIRHRQAEREDERKRRDDRRHPAKG